MGIENSERDNKIMEYVANGYSFDSLENIFSLSSARIGQIAKKLGFRKDNNIERDKKISNVRSRENKTYKEIGKVFGISQERVRQIIAKSRRNNLD